jgi:hypothetical protein
MTKKIKEASPQLLLIDWEDASTITHGDWLSREEVMEDAHADKFLNRTVGWLLHEDKQAIILAAQVADGEKPQFDLVMRIPKSLIRKRRVLQ